MNAPTTVSGFRRLAALLVLGLLASAQAARAQSPDFDAVGWTPIGCPAADLTADASPSAVNFVGDATYPAAYYAFDASFLYFRYRMDGNPNGPGGFAQYAWTALMQVPSGNPFQYQYQLSLNGQNDNVEIWANTSASDIDFSPLFHDESEVNLFSEPYTTRALARSLATGDGSSFSNGPDYFLDFALPVSELVAQGVIAAAADLGDSFFFPASSTNSNNYNKGYLNCSFLPTTEVAIDKTVGPTQLVANTTTPLVYTIAAFNAGAEVARGVTIDDIALPAWMTNVVATVASDDPTVTWTLVSTNPLQVQIPELPMGATVSVQLAADALPTCADADFLNVATVAASNAMDDAATAFVDIQQGDGVELCDGADNDCDGQTDEGTAVLCDDGDACNGAETCGGAAGCVAGTPPTCDDQNACTTDACDPASGCTHAAVGGCTPCTTAADCEDGDTCTAHSCDAGVCGTALVPNCMPCATDADCTDDGNACTVEACTAGTCAATALPGCVPCTTEADCGDGNVCTTDTCAAGVCGHAAIPDCLFPVPDAEVCGNCRDDDGDGLVDYEDPDCCAGPAVLGIRRLMLKPSAVKARGNRLRLRSRGVSFAAAAFDPMTQDTTLQLSDASGQIFCQTIAAPRWKHPRSRVYRFRDKQGAFAGGLKKGNFRMRRSGEIVFRTRGKKVVVKPMSAGPVTVTLRVGDQCAQSRTPLRTRRKALVFP